ncbi:MAG: efflux RND transporter periplasmic adaptor subunit [Deltaproteobacteria bacterium]|nr:efflux RND transporter periplasmic adaptor subunit [Deltaproteobacteria bacterium]MCW5807516.1 efflux RND transporter periplasmic adaptor subunit [Deltaproteobacteria bacterium]
MAHRRRRTWALSLLALLALVGLVVAIVWFLRARRTEKKPAPPPVAVVAARAEVADLPVHLDTIGTVTSFSTVAIASQVTGIVKAVLYSEGQVVQAGAPLLEIEPRPFQAALAQAEGTLRHDVELLAQARTNLDRFRAAWKANAIARQQLEDQEALVRQTEGTVAADRGAVETARINLGWTRITAPIGGRLGLRLVDPGNFVTATSGTPLVVITQLQPISVVYPVAEDALDQLWRRPGHGAGLEVTVLDRTRKRTLAVGALHTIDNQIDTTTGTVRARATFANADGALFPNQFVNTRTLVQTLRGVIAVPSSAVQRDGEKAFVYDVGAGRAHVVPVEVGASDGERTQVHGLAAGARVANSSFEKLREGVPVTLEEERPEVRATR